MPLSYSLCGHDKACAHPTRVLFLMKVQRIWRFARKSNVGCHPDAHASVRYLLYGYAAYPNPTFPDLVPP